MVGWSFDGRTMLGDRGRNSKVEPKAAYSFWWGEWIKSYGEGTCGEENQPRLSLWEHQYLRIRQVKRKRE